MSNENFSFSSRVSYIVVEKAGGLSPPAFKEENGPPRADQFQKLFVSVYVLVLVLVLALALGL